MKLFILFIVSLLTITLSLKCQQDTSGLKDFDNPYEFFGQENRGKVFPAFEVAQNDGSVLSNKDLKNKVTFINFWFAACEPCIAEMEALNNLYQQYKSDAHFKFIPFTYEDSNSIRRINNQYKLQFPIITITPEECYRLNFKSGFPTNILLNVKTKVARIFTGGVRNKEEAQRVFDKLIQPAINDLMNSTSRRCNCKIKRRS